MDQFDVNFVASKEISPVIGEIFTKKPFYMAFINHLHRPIVHSASL